MSIPVSPTQTDDEVPIRPSPLVHRVFGEPRFHTDGDIAAIAFAADGTLFSIDEAGLLRHWAADGKLLARHFLSDLETLWCFSPNAKVLASGNDDLILWDVATGQLLSRIEQPEESAWITAMAFSPDGATVATGHDDGKVRFWGVASPKFLGQIQAHPEKPLKKAVSAISFSPNQQFVATAGEDRSRWPNSRATPTVFRRWRGRRIPEH
jgi:WD40 repeat protein